MQWPDPPHLETAFYVSEMTESDALRAAARAILLSGGTFSGETVMARGSNLRRAPFARETLSHAVSAHTLGHDRLLELLDDPDAKVLGIGFTNAIGVEPGRPEVLTLYNHLWQYPGEPQVAESGDRLPIAIVADGRLFGGWINSRQRQRARAAGNRVYSAFLRLVAALLPAYAAITVEVPLPPPSLLLRGHGSRAFGDFFVSERILGSEAIRSIEDAFAGAYTEPTGDGIYISSFAPFNPARSQLEQGARLEASTKVRSILALLAATS